MTDPLSPSDANDEKGYSSLEERIVRTERDRDREVRKSVRFEPWQKVQIDYIADNIGTNQAEVVNRAYSEGLSVSKEKLGDSINGLDDINTVVRNIIMINVDKDFGVYDVEKEYTQLSVDFDRSEWSDTGLADPVKVPIRDSELSEVKHLFVANMYFDGWVHRALISFGLGESEYIGDGIEQRVQLVEDEFENAIQKSQEEIELLLYKYIKSKMEFWLGNGIEDDELELLREGIRNMETKYRAKCERIVDKMSDG